MIAGNSMLKIFLRDKIIQYNKKYPNIKIRVDSGRHLEALKNYMMEKQILFLLIKKVI